MFFGPKSILKIVLIIRTGQSLNMSLCLPHMKWWDLLFLAPLSVCLSARPSVRPPARPPTRSPVRPSVRPSRLNCVRSISFEPLVGFTNNSAHMSSRIYDESMCSAYVLPRSVQGQGQSSRLTLLDCITCLLYNSSSVGDILKWRGTHVKYHKTMCRAHVWPRSHQGQCESIRWNTLSCPPYIF